jgi:transposase
MLTGERTTVGLDVHARSVVAGAVDWSTGQVFSDRLVPANEVVLAWVAKLPAPVAVTYEAGPTGFGLARAFAAAGIRCEVVAPSKLERPPGDRIKTDRRDARRAARLLHIGEITGIRIPTVVEEDARDLLRAREATRADLMRARHRASKLLLRHGIVYSGGKTWNGVHERWLRAQRFDLPGTRTAFEESLDAVLAATARRDRLDEQIEATAATPEWAPIVSRLGAIRGVATLTGLGLAVEIGDSGPVHRLLDRRLPRAGAHRVLQRQQPAPGIDHQDRQYPRPQAAGRGRVATRPAAAAHARQSPDATPRWATSRCAGPGRGRRPTTAPPLARDGSPQQAGQRHRGGGRPRTGRLVLEPGHHAGLTHPRAMSARTQTGRWENPPRAARGTTRECTMSQLRLTPTAGRPPSTPPRSPSTGVCPPAASNTNHTSYTVSWTDPDRAGPAAGHEQWSRSW